MTRKINDPKVPWSGRGSRYTEDEIDFVVKAMREADPLTQGRYQTEFEERFRTFTGANHAFAVSSGTAALELAAILSQVGPGDEVVVPAHTFAASAIPFGRTGARLVWADIDPATLVVTGETLARVVTDRTKVIVVVHLYGLVCDMEPIMALARARNILVVEDAAQALGAADNGRQAGSIGDFGCFSFHTHKNMTTLGEGGMLTVRDPALAAIVPGMRHNGMRAFDEDRDRYWHPAMGNVDFDWNGVWPHNFCIGEVQCAAGLVQLDRVTAMNSARKARASLFIDSLKEYPELVFQPEPHGRDNVRYCLPAYYDSRATGARRDDFMERMAFHHRVGMVVQYHPLHRYPLFVKAGFGAADVPNTDAFFDGMVSFPFHEWMPNEQFDYMIAATCETCDHLRN